MRSPGCFPLLELGLAMPDELHGNCVYCLPEPRGD